MKRTVCISVPSLETGAGWEVATTACFSSNLLGLAVKQPKTLCKLLEIVRQGSLRLRKFRIQVVSNLLQQS
ncbi:hypothetical protein [Paenibacillus sp. A3]|uniref:hypothetical protein n=1 Tax=Paenibacillus sp. A3 TaxID=1337054 RepID=UPI0012F7D97E|nr:hypothetical protein [Paenibacillus sp. A3]